MKKKNKNKMQKKRKVALIIIALLMFTCIGLGVYRILVFAPNKNKKNITKVIDSIKGFDYKLEDRDKTLYKNEFMSLKQTLEKQDIDYDEYAKIIARMFIIDLYTLDNKINKYDVGSIEFVYPSTRDNFSLNVTDTLNKYIIDKNNVKKRNQKLPEVATIELDNIEEIKYELLDEVVDAYKVDLTWSYVTDLKYDTKGQIIIIKEDKYLYIVEKNEGNSH